MNRANTGILGEGDMLLSRRDFLGSTAATLVSGPAFVAMGPNDSSIS